MNKTLSYTTLFLLIASTTLYAGTLYKVRRVVDGDTIVVDYQNKSEKVRLLCVNTPESVHPDQSKNCELGRKASAYTKSRLSNKNKMEDRALEVEIQDLKARAQDSRWGQVFGFLIGVITVAAGAYTATKGFQWSGSFIGTSGVIGLVSVFVIGRKRQ